MGARREQIVSIAARSRLTYRRVRALVYDSDGGSVHPAERRKNLLTAAALVADMARGLSGVVEDIRRYEAEAAELCALAGIPWDEAHDASVATLLAAEKEILPHLDELRAHLTARAAAVDDEDEGHHLDE